MNPVLCITKSKLNLKNGINQINIDPSDIHFINRNIVDNQEYHDIAKQFLQLLPYVAIKCGNEYLTYARKGSEQRLHGKRSMGFGGHVELCDLQHSICKTLTQSANRELNEETGLNLNIKLTHDYIYSDYDNVSLVHLGIIGVVEIEDKSLIIPDKTEILNPAWKTIDSIRARIDAYERWSQILVKYLDR